MIEAKHITKTIITGKQTIPILKNISFSLQKGSITAVVGKSGCGKSTLLSILAGIDPPVSGEVILNGTNFYRQSPAAQERFPSEQIGLLFQNYHLIPELTCEENVRMPLAFSRHKERASKVGDMLEQVGLAAKKSLFPRQMSGGEQQRTAILRAIVNEPTLLFADEPTGALDSGTGSQVIHFLINYAHCCNVTVLLVTHDMDIANQCDRTIFMKDGHIAMPVN